jgi:hypothetical protein
MGALIDETGRRYGALVVLERAGYTAYRKPLWKVVCDCGTEKAVVGDWLREGRVKSCSTSCLKRPGRKSVEHYCATAVQASYRHNAAQAGRAWDLSFDDVVALIFSACRWCGTEAGNTFTAPGRKDRPSCKYNGIDRVDNSQGYVKGNVAACCGDCNYLKQEWEVEKWLAHMSKILEWSRP